MTFRREIAQSAFLVKRISDLACNDTWAFRKFLPSCDSRFIERRATRRSSGSARLQQKHS